jgi:hypothetical protein
VRVSPWKFDEPTMTFSTNVLFDHCKQPHPISFQLKDKLLEQLDRTEISELMGSRVHDAMVEHEQVCNPKIKLLTLQDS